MNIAFDLIERDHEAIAECMARFEKRPHRSTVLELCSLIEQHERMERELVHPVLDATAPEHAHEQRTEHGDIVELVQELQGTSDKTELREGTATLINRFKAHAKAEERTQLPAMEDALGVARMNKLGLSLLDWQHTTAREQQDRDDGLEQLLELTRAELYEKAQEADISGRSNMKKEELAEALAEN